MVVVEPGNNNLALRDRRTSTLQQSTDPFAPREGKALVWRNVSMSLAGTNDEPPRYLLHKVWGEVPPKETTAIMGASGAGKTSLLNILAGRSSSRGKIAVTADVRLDNVTVDPTKMAVRKVIAFVAQDDSLQVTATPREAIHFSAKLRLPRSTTESQLRKLTHRMLTELGLMGCADTIVGGALIKGISGKCGERKRASVGVELVTKPTLVFLDEPTSGLDSYSSVQVIHVLKKVAKAGASVLFTIHQPSSEIFASFDRLIMMNRGRVMYQGPVRNVPAFLRTCGRPLPKHYNPADWIMDIAQLVSDDQLEKEGFYLTDPRDIGEPLEPDERQDAFGRTITRMSIRGNVDLIDMPPGFWTQTSLLFYREVVNITRDLTAIIARFSLTIFMGILVGIIFFNVGKTNPTQGLNLQSHFGALLMAIMLSMFGNAQPALLAFPQERPVFLREYSTNHYSAVAYFISRFTVEAVITAFQTWVSCIITYFLVGFQAGFGVYYAVIYTLGMASTAVAVLLGCSVEDPKLAQEFLPIIFVPQMLFAGFFVASDLIPVWLRWAQYLCTLTYALRILLVAEFENCGGTANPTWSDSCNALIVNVGANPNDTWWYWIVLTMLFAVFRVAALVVLRKKASKYF